MAAAVVIRLTAMGDVLLAVPAVRTLAERGFKVHWVLSNTWKDLAPFLPAEVHLLENPSLRSGFSGFLRTAKVLRKLGPALVFDLQGKPISFILSLILNKKTFRYQKRSLSENLNVIAGKYPLRDGNPDPVWMRYLKTVEEPMPQKGAKDTAHDPRIEIPLSNRNEAKEFLSGFDLQPGKFVILHPGASYPGKIIPPTGVSALISKITDRIVAIGRTHESPDLKFETDLRDKIPLSLLPGLMTHAKGIVTSDSGPMHLGRAAGIRVAGLFFQTDPSLGFSPVPGADVRIFSRPLPCKPCSLHGQRSVCPEGTWACRELEWNKVAGEIGDFLR